MKTKLVLGILAAAASLSLAVGGTLMLFTDTSKEATNVVTLGNADIELQEATTDDKNYYGAEGGAWTVSDDAYTTVSEAFPGITYKSNAVPGDAFAKAPRVVNEGSVPVYVKVEGALTITPPADAPWGEINEIIGTDYAGIFGEYFGNVVLGYNDANWDGAPVTVDTSVSGVITVSGTWYYATGGIGDYGTLAVLAPDGATAPIFTGIALPVEIPNAFKDFEFSFDLTAYAVQSDNNAPAGNTAEAFEDVFR
jgi:predicted ribosomally synthesized peptide with SipW-like signal peptide